MIIDCHSHLGRNEHIKANVKELLNSMDLAGIDKSLVFAGELNNLTTAEMLEEIKPHRDRLYGVASWDFDYRYKHRDAPHDEQVDNLLRFYEAKEIVAIKFYTGYYHHMPTACEPLWRMNEIGCPAIFHCGDCLNSVKCAKLKYSHPLNIDEVAVDYPKMNFIIAHMGYPWHRDAAEVCYKNDNVYADISGFVYGEFQQSDKEIFNKVLNEFTEISSPQKLLFGTDWPISNQMSYRNVVDLHPKDSISAESLSQNVKKAFKL